MKNIISILSVIFLTTFLLSCTKTIKPAPNQAVEYEQGIAVLKSHKQNGVVVRLLSNEFNSENPPALYIAVANYGDKPFIFSTRNISVKINGRLIKVFTYEDLKRKIEVERAWTSFAIGMNAISQSIMAAQPTYSYTSGFANKSYSGNFDSWTYGNFGNSGYGSVNTSGNFRGSSNSYYSASTTTYDPAKTAQAQAAINANMTNQLALVASSANIQLNNLKVMLRENTVKQSEYRGGVVILDPAFIASGSKMTMSITTPTDKHLFYFDIPSRSTKQTQGKSSNMALIIDKKKVPITALVLKKSAPVKYNEKKTNKLSKRWEKIGITSSGLSLFIDKKTISHHSENMVRVWVKTINNSNDFLDLVEIDCLNQKIRNLESQKNESAFSKISNEWRFIVPESQSEIISNSTCIKNDENK